MKTEEDKYSIFMAKDFTDSPGGEYINQGDFSGELFLKEHLLPKFNVAVRDHRKLLIFMHDLCGLPFTFIRGSFGKLSSEYGCIKVLQTIKVFVFDNNLKEDEIIEIIVENDPKYKL